MFKMIHLKTKHTYQKQKKKKKKSKKILKKKYKFINILFNIK